MGDQTVSILAGIKANGEDEDEEEDQEATKEAGAAPARSSERSSGTRSSRLCMCSPLRYRRCCAVCRRRCVEGASVHSPRMLKELAPTLTQAHHQAAGQFQYGTQASVASNAPSGELIRKAGDGVLATLLPDPGGGSVNLQRRGCQAGHLPRPQGAYLVGALQTRSRTTRRRSSPSCAPLSPTSDDDVREAAAEAFDSLQQILGKRAVDQVLPYLLNLLRSEENATTRWLPSSRFLPRLRGPTSSCRTSSRRSSRRPSRHSTPRRCASLVQGCWCGYEPPAAQHHQLAHGQYRQLRGGGEHT